MNLTIHKSPKPNKWRLVQLLWKLICILAYSWIFLGRCKYQDVTKNTPEKPPPDLRLKVSDLRSCTYTKGGCLKTTQDLRLGHLALRLQRCLSQMGDLKMGWKYTQKITSGHPMDSCRKERIPQKFDSSPCHSKKNASKDHCLSQKGSGSVFFGHIFKDMVKNP